MKGCHKCCCKCNSESSPSDNLWDIYCNALPCDQKSVGSGQGISGALLLKDTDSVRFCKTPLIAGTYQPEDIIVQVMGERSLDDCGVTGPSGEYFCPDTENPFFMIDGNTVHAQVAIGITGMNNINGTLLVFVNVPYYMLGGAFSAKECARGVATLGDQTTSVRAVTKAYADSLLHLPSVGDISGNPFVYAYFPRMVAYNNGDTLVLTFSYNPSC